MSLPETVLVAIRGGAGFWSEHAAENADRLALAWSDIIGIAESAETCKKQRDLQRPGHYTYGVVGRDTRGRRLYMAGKVVHYEGEHRWKVITVHEAD